MRKDTTINIRTAPETIELLDQAAELQNQSRSTFILSCATEMAKDILLDKTEFTLASDDFSKFQDALDRPAKNIEGLKKLLKATPPWEKAQ